MLQNDAFICSKKVYYLGHILMVCERPNAKTNSLEVLSIMLTLVKGD